jgi:hypothetical protein
MHGKRQQAYLQVITNEADSKSLRIIGDYPRGTPISHLHDSLNIESLRDFIQHLTAKFFTKCPFHPNPLVQQIGNYTLANLNSGYKIYKYKLPNIHYC